jgi:hypothetical protein
VAEFVDLPAVLRVGVAAGAPIGAFFNGDVDVDPGSGAVNFQQFSKLALLACAIDNY